MRESDVFNDFARHIQRLHKQARGHQHTPVDEWDNKGAWFGFFEDLQERLGDGGFGHVPNPSGGFPGFWWGGSEEIDGVEAYLQLEGDKLCVKISTDITDAEFRRHARNEWSDHITTYAQAHEVNLMRPARLRSGAHMTVAALPGDYRFTRADGSVGFDDTVVLLQRITVVVQDAAGAKREAPKN